ncbi:MAG: hypothetical protein P9M02_04585 [Candidatus Susulua stagnicola]|nr:hypothetical protein [Candidatus Susulua stagnicola]
MYIDFSLFIAVILSAWVVFAFCLEYICDESNTLVKKEVQLVRRKCEVCASVYFVSVFFEFWRCPLCGSINKEK